MKIQPSLERVKVNALLDFEIAETSSSSETRLFSFLSPEKRTFAPESPPNPKSNMKNRIEATSAILTIGLLARPFPVSSVVGGMENF